MFARYNEHLIPHSLSCYCEYSLNLYTDEIIPPTKAPFATVWVLLLKTKMSVLEND